MIADRLRRYPDDGEEHQGRSDQQGAHGATGGARVGSIPTDPVVHDVFQEQFAALIQRLSAAHRRRTVLLQEVVEFVT